MSVSSFIVQLLIVLAIPICIYVIHRYREVENLKKEIDQLRRQVDVLNQKFEQLDEKLNNSILFSPVAILSQTENSRLEEKEKSSDSSSIVPVITEEENLPTTEISSLPPISPEPPFNPSFPVRFMKNDTEKTEKEDEAHAKSWSEEQAPVPSSVVKSENSTSSPLSMEYFVGTKLLSWVGGFTLFLGLSFFVKYSIENNLVSPVLRVILTYLSGILLLGAGLFIRRFPTYSVLSHTLMAIGTLVLYLGTCAGKLFYDFPFYTMGVTATFLILTTILALSLSVRLRSQVIAVLGVAGGFITPYIIFSEIDNTVPLYIYISLLNTGLAAIILFRKWTYLVWIGIIGTTLFTLIWVCLFQLEQHGAAFLLFTTYVISLYTITAFRLGSVSAKEKAIYFSALGTFVCVLFFSAIFLPQGLSMGLLIQRHPLDLTCFALYPLLPLTVTLCLCRRYPVVSAIFPVASLFNILAYLSLLGALDALPLNLQSRFSECSLLFFGFFSLLGIIHMAFSYLSWRKVKEVPLSFLILLLPIIFISVLLPIGYYDTGFDTRVARQSVTLGFLCVYASGSLFLALREGKGSYLLISLLACTAFFSNHLLPAILVTIVFFLFPLCFCNKFKNAFIPWLVSALSLLCLYPFLRYEHLLNYPYAQSWLPGLTALLLALPQAGAALQLQKKTEEELPRRKSATTVYWAFCLGFITLFIAEFFEKEGLTIALALEGAALMWLNLKFPTKWLVKTGMAFMSIVFARLVLNPYITSYHPVSDAFLWNWYLYTYGIACVACLAGARALSHDRSPQNTTFTQFLNAEGGILLFALINLEIANTFTPPGSSSFSISFGNSLACDLTYSIAWGLFAMGLLILGLVKRNKAPRITGLILLGITLLKLFLYDLSALDQMFRIAALVVLSVIILVSSILYQKYLVSEKNRGTREQKPLPDPSDE